MSPSSVRLSTRRIDCGLLGLTEEALAGAQDDREDPEPQLVDQAVLQQRARRSSDAGRDDDVPCELGLQAL